MAGERLFVPPGELVTGDQTVPVIERSLVVLRCLA